MDDRQDRVDISTAAARMGITPEAVRKRIKRGTLQATKQDGRWVVTAANNVHDTAQNVQDARPDDKDKLIQILTEELEARRQEIKELQEDRRREVQELHVLLQTAQALTAPERRSWWRWWK